MDALNRMSNQAKERLIEDNILLAKRLLVDSIYQQANLEGIAVTYANTNDILNNVNVSTLTPNDISKICCLRDGWHFVLDKIKQDVDLVFIEDLHSIIARFDVPYFYLGVPRTDAVRISGTNWQPEIPNVDEVFLELHKYFNASNIDDCIKVGLYLMRTQFFKDGNKRIGSFVINKYLISNGFGLFNVPVEIDSIFKMHLVKFYESNKYNDILDFIKNKCIISM